MIMYHSEFSVFCSGQFCISSCIGELDQTSVPICPGFVDSHFTVVWQFCTLCMYVWCIIQCSQCNKKCVL